MKLVEDSNSSFYSGPRWSAFYKKNSPVDFHRRKRTENRLRCSAGAGSSVSLNSLGSFSLSSEGFRGRLSLRGSGSVGGSICLRRRIGRRGVRSLRGRSIRSLGGSFAGSSAFILRSRRALIAGHFIRNIAVGNGRSFRGRGFLRTAALGGGDRGGNRRRNTGAAGTAGRRTVIVAAASYQRNCQSSGQSDQNCFFHVFVHAPVVGSISFLVN